MPSLASLQQQQDHLIRKALTGALFIAPMSAALPTTLTSGSSSDLVALPDDYVDMGLISKGDGLQWAREMSESTIESWGRPEPTRRDTTSDFTSLQFTAQEPNRQTLELYNSVDLSAVTPTPTPGEVAFSQPTRPARREYRAYAIFQDGEGADAIYMARLLPRTMVSERSGQAWTDGDDGVFYPMTLAAQVDATAGYSVRHFFGGPGWKALLVDMGFPAAA